MYLLEEWRLSVLFLITLLRHFIFFKTEGKPNITSVDINTLKRVALSQSLFS